MVQLVDRHDGSIASSYYETMFDLNGIMKKQTPVRKVLTHKI